VKRQTGAEQHRDEPAEELVGGGEAQASSSLVQLTDEQKQVLDCLQDAGTGLTRRQIVARVSCPPSVVEDALESLVAANLVGRLNTLVPSYACKYPGVRVYTE
jgi:Fe2+ or Zn2+ uptake regulation protein